MTFLSMTTSRSATIGLDELLPTVCMHAGKALCHPDPRNACSLYQVGYIIFNPASLPGSLEATGKNVIAYFKIVGAIAGFDNWETVHNHLLRERGASPT
eukprot:scaffold78376_cov71-Attheya_sp.AAC.1